MTPSQEFFDGLARYQAAQRVASDMARDLVHYQSLTLAKLKISGHHQFIQSDLSRNTVKSGTDRMVDFLHATGLLRLSSVKSEYAHVFYQPPRQSLACPEAIVLIRLFFWPGPKVQLRLSLYGTEEQLDLLHHLIESHIEDHKLTVYHE